MFNFIGVFHESTQVFVLRVLFGGVIHEFSETVRASSFIWRVIMSFLKLLVTFKAFISTSVYLMKGKCLLIYSPVFNITNGKFYQSKHLTKLCLAFS